MRDWIPEHRRYNAPPRDDKYTEEASADDEERKTWQALQDRIAQLEAMLRAAGYSSAQIKAGTPYVEVMGG